MVGRAGSIPFPSPLYFNTFKLDTIFPFIHHDHCAVMSRARTSKKKRKKLTMTVSLKFMMKNPQYEIFTFAVGMVLFPARTKLKEHKEAPVPIDRGPPPP